MPAWKRALGTVIKGVFSCAIWVLILGAVIALAGPQIGDAVGNAAGELFAPRPWKGVYTAEHLGDNASADFKIAGDCIAWGLKQVEAHGGSYKCGTDCTSQRIGNTVTYTCRNVVP